VEWACSKGEAEALYTQLNLSASLTEISLRSGNYIMTSRRKFLKTIPALALSGISLPSLTGCILKSNIESKKEYKYLKDHKLRHKEIGENKILNVDDAIFYDGEAFRDELWDNIVFKNCVFKGKTNLDLLTGCLFQNCSFDACGFESVKIIGARFEQCQLINNATIMSDKDAKNVTFENCEMYGIDRKKYYNWCGVGLVGDVSFRNCKAKWVNLFGEGKVEYEGCQFDDVALPCGYSSPDKKADIVVKQCVFKGTIDISSNVTNLAISDTRFDRILMKDMDIKNLSVENSKGGEIKFGSDENVDSITLRNIELTGFHEDDMKSPDKTGSLQCYVSVKLKTLVMENVHCSPDATESDSKDPILRNAVGNMITCGSESASIKNCILPIVSFWLKDSKDVEFQGLQSDSIHFFGGVDKLNFSSECKIKKNITFVETEAKEVDLIGLTTAKGCSFISLASNFKIIENGGKLITKWKKWWQK
jgi:uncharacterized protein YjbI with pentapeptide repeats